MNPERQRIAIAEACGAQPRRTGWCVHHPTEPLVVLSGVTREEAVDWLWSRPDSSPFKHYELREEVEYPDYLNDLNAMNQAEKQLRGNQTAVFEEKLCQIQVNAFENDAEVGLWPIWHASAAHRAEAFLKAVGKWEEE